MIHYSLRCAKGHVFEGWFRSIADYDTQSAKGLLSCNQCGSAQVEKALMAPNVAPSDKRAAAPATKEQRAEQHAFGRKLPPELVEAARRLRTYVRDNAEYVGPRFADEARRIHYEEVEARGIYGEATREEALALHEEGIEAHPLPAIPDDAN